MSLLETCLLWAGACAVAGGIVAVCSSWVSARAKDDADLRSRVFELEQELRHAAMQCDRLQAEIPRLVDEMERLRRDARAVLQEHADRIDAVEEALEETHGN